MKKYLFVLFLMLTLVSCVLAHDITINEVYYTVKNNSNKAQWIELYNESDNEIDIRGWKISTTGNPGDGFTIPAGTVIKSESYVVLASSKDVMASLWGLSKNVVEYDEALFFEQSGDNIHLYDSNNNLIDEIWYGTGGEKGSTNAAGTVSFGMSLARNPDGSDTDNPSSDLSERFPTPGNSNLFTGFSQSTWGKIKAIYSIKNKFFL